MISHEVIQNQITAETIKAREKYTFQGVSLEFREFQPTLMLIDEAQLKKIKKILYDSYLMFRDYSPDQALVIYDEQKPRLFILKGTREWWLEKEENRWEYYRDEDFLKICQIDSEDNEIFCESPLGGYRQLSGIYNALHCLPAESRSGGKITFWKDESKLSFKVTPREGYLKYG